MPEDKRLQYHNDQHHYSNWCKVCGLYFCWHDEAKEFDVHNHYQNDGRAKGHKFEPSEVEGRMGDKKLAIQEEEKQK